jgi:hypothetical protein
MRHNIVNRIFVLLSVLIIGACLLFAKALAA